MDVAEFLIDFNRDRSSALYRVVLSSGGGQVPVLCEFVNPLTVEDLRDIPTLLRQATREYIDYIERFTVSMRATVSRRDKTGQVSAEEQLKQKGRLLYNALFSSPEAQQAFVEHLRGNAHARVRVRLLLPAELQALPWELLCHPEDRNGWIFQSSGVPLVRTLKRDDKTMRLQSAELLRTRPVRMLVVAANPRGTDPLDVEAELGRLREVLTVHKELGYVDFRVVEGKGTLRKIDQAFDQITQAGGGGYHIFHFIGHGQYGAEAPEGSLLIEDDNGHPFSWRATDVANTLGPQRGLRLVVLNACNTGREHSGSAVAGVATAVLSMTNTPAVVAMQDAVSDGAAKVFTERLYGAISYGQPLEFALAWARAKMSGFVSLGRRHLGPAEEPTVARAAEGAARSSAEWSIPVLYLQNSEGIFFTPPQIKADKVLDKAMARIADESYTTAAQLFTLIAHHVESVDGNESYHKYSQTAEQLHECLQQYRRCKSYAPEPGAERSDAEQWVELRDNAEQLIQELEEIGLLPTEWQACAAHWVERMEQAKRWKTWAEAELAVADLFELVQEQVAGGKLEEAEKTLNTILRKGAYLSRHQEAQEALGALPLLREAHTGIVQIRTLLDQEKPNYLEIDTRALAIEGLLQRMQPTARWHNDWIERWGAQLKAWRELASLTLGWSRDQDEIRRLIESRKLASAAARLAAFRRSAQPPPEHLLAPLDESLERERARVAEAGVRLAALRHEPYLVEPGLPWGEKNPYVQLAGLGFAPSASRATIFDMGPNGLGRRAMAAGQSILLLDLQNPESRLWYDLFAFELSDPERVRACLPDEKADDSDWPSDAELGADAPILHFVLQDEEAALKMALRHLHDKPLDDAAAHTAALIATLLAQQAGRDERPADADDEAKEARRAELRRLWELAIAAWAMLLSSRTFWARWSARRREFFGENLEDALFARLRDRLRADLGQHLLELAQGAGADRRTAELYLALEERWRREIFAADALVRCIEDYAPRPGKGDDRRALAPCGRLGLDMLGLKRQLSDYVSYRVLREREEENPPAEQLSLNLRWTFSELAAAATLYTRGLYQIAVNMLLQGEQLLPTPPCGRTTCPQHGQRLGKRPRVCCDASPAFEERNPAFDRRPDRGPALYADACELLRLAALKLGEEALTSTQLDLEVLRQHWGLALDLANELGVRALTLSTIRTLIIGRCHSLQNQLDSEAPYYLERLDRLRQLADLGLSYTGTDDSYLATLLADTLTRCGIEIARGDNLSAHQLSVTYLQRAIELNPSAQKARSNLAAAMAYVARDSEHLDEIRNVLRRAQQLATGLIREGYREWDIFETLRMVARYERRSLGGIDHTTWRELSKLLADVRDQLSREARSELNVRVLNLIQLIEELLRDELNQRTISASFGPNLEADEIDRLVVEAYRLVRSDNHEQALSYWSRIVEQRPKDRSHQAALVSSVLEVGEAMMRRAERQNALALLSEWISRYPQEARLIRFREQIELEIQLFGP